MDRKERLQFFKQVLHEKIRWSGWSKEDYFIPHSIDEDIEELIGYDEEGDECSYEIENGFDKSSGWYWEFYENKEICTKEDGDKWYNFQYSLDEDKYICEDNRVLNVYINGHKMRPMTEEDLTGTIGSDFSIFGKLGEVSICQHEYEEKQLFTSSYKVCKKCGVEQ